MGDTVIGALREYFEECPLLRGARLNAGYLPESAGPAGAEYSIDALPADEVLTRYIDGARLCRYMFAIRSVGGGAGAAQAAERAEFFERLARWINGAGGRRQLPRLPRGLQARGMRAQSAGGRTEGSAQGGKYQIECVLTYFREGER